jgi:hypothetical protein
MDFAGLMDQAEKIFDVVSKDVMSTHISAKDMLIFMAWFVGMLAFLFFIYINRHRIRYNVLLFFKSLTEGGMRRNILGLLIKKKYQVDLYVEDGTSKYILCKTKMIRITGTYLEMKVLRNIALHPRYRGQKILCFHRPVIFLYWIFNSFHTYPTQIEMHSDPSKIKLRLKMPLKVDTETRRVHPRMRIKNQDLIKVRGWVRWQEIGAGSNFRFMQPHFQVGVEGRGKTRSSGRVDNLSVGGIRLSTHVDSMPRKPAENDDVCLELFIFDRVNRGYRTFLMRSRVRSLLLDNRGYLHMGYQFLALGNTDAPNRTLKWESIEMLDGCEAIGRAMEHMLPPQQSSGKRGRA